MEHAPTRTAWKGRSRQIRGKSILSFPIVWIPVAVLRGFPCRFPAIRETGHFLPEKNRRLAAGPPDDPDRRGHRSERRGRYRGVLGLERIDLTAENTKIAKGVHCFLFSAFFAVRPLSALEHAHDLIGSGNPPTCRRMSFPTPDHEILFPLQGSDSVWSATRTRTPPNAGHG